MGETTEQKQKSQPKDQPTSPQEKVWFTVKELSQEWGLSESWIRAHANFKRPRIRGHRFGKVIKFHRDDLKTFLTEVATDRNTAA